MDAGLKPGPRNRADGEQHEHANANAETEYRKNTLQRLRTGPRGENEEKKYRNALERQYPPCYEPPPGYRHRCSREFEHAGKYSDNNSTGKYVVRTHEAVREAE